MNNEKLSMIANSRENNINLLKFIVTILVIVSHAFPISLGKDTMDFFSNFSFKQTSFGGLAVDTLFIISGYLITKSLIKNNNLKNFFKKRVSRIFFPLFIMLFISVFIISPFFCEQSLVNYFSNFSPYVYFIKNLFLITTHKINGVFSSNIYQDSINGSLWTLPIQFLCYIFSIIVFNLKRIKKEYFLYVFPFVLAIFFFRESLFSSYIITNTINVCTMFYIGILIYLFKDKINLNFKLFIIVIIFYFVFLLCNFYDISKILTLPYIIIYLCYGIKPVLKKYSNTMGEISYQMYLWAFFIQQVIVKLYNGTMNPYINMLLAIPITCIVAFVQVRYIENPLINFMKNIKKQRECN